MSSNPPTNRTGHSVFRAQALANADRAPLGGVHIVQPVTFRVITLMLVTLLGLVGAFLVTGTYARKVTVSGYLEPTTGRIAVFPPPTGGLWDEVYVADGDRVEAGQPLAAVRRVQADVDGQRLDEQTHRQLLTQKQQIERQISALEEDQRRHERQLRSDIAGLDMEIEQLQEAWKLQEQRLNVSSQHLHAVQQLRQRGLASEREKLSALAARVEEEQRLGGIQRQLTRVDAQRTRQTHDLARLHNKEAIRRAGLARDLAETERRLIDANVQHGRLLTAPVAGVVTSMQAAVGGVADHRKPLLSILPQVHTLRAVLLIPSSAVGFVAEGLRVYLKLDAFPPEQFGTHGATITRVSEAARAPEELSGPVIPRLPVYVAHAKLDQQLLSAYGAPIELQSDMLANADIVLAERTLLQWLLEPLYRLRGRET